MIRRPYGPGWALVGDAGLVLDPITAQGIGYAFRDAELIAEAVGAGRGSLDRALAGYERARDRAAVPMFRFTADLAALRPPPPELMLLLAAVRERPDELERFLGVLTGTVPLRAYFAPGNLRRLVGVRGLARMMLGRVRGTVG